LDLRKVASLLGLGNTAASAGPGVSEGPGDRRDASGDLGRNISNTGTPGAISLGERTVWLRRLAGLAVQGGREPWAWKAEAAAMLGSYKPLVGLQSRADQLVLPGTSIPPLDSAVGRQPEDKASGGEASQRVQTAAEFAVQLRGIVDSAIRIVEEQPITFIGDPQILSEVEEAFTRQVRFWFPILFVVVVGGTLFGMWKVDGLITAANQAAETIKAKLADATKEIDQAKKAAQEAIAASKKSVDDAAGPVLASIAASKKNVDDAAGPILANIAASKKSVDDAAGPVLASIAVSKKSVDDAAGPVLANIAASKKSVDDLSNQIADQGKKQQELSDSISNARPIVEQLAGIAQTSEKLLALPADQRALTISAALMIAPYLNPLLYGSAIAAAIAVLLGIAALILARPPRRRRRALQAPVSGHDRQDGG
jgi:hypothetical protein